MATGELEVTHPAAAVSPLLFGGPPFGPSRSSGGITRSPWAALPAGDPAGSTTPPPEDDDDDDDDDDDEQEDVFDDGGGPAARGPYDEEYRGRRVGAASQRCGLASSPPRRFVSGRRAGLSSLAGGLGGGQDPFAAAAAPTPTTTTAPSCFSRTNDELMRDVVQPVMPALDARGHSDDAREDDPAAAAQGATAYGGTRKKPWVSSNCLYSGPQPLEGHVLVLARCRSRRSAPAKKKPSSKSSKAARGAADASSSFRLSWRSAYFSLSNGGVLRIFRSPEDRARWTDLGTTCENLAKWRAPVTDAFVVSAVADLPARDAPTTPPGSAFASSSASSKGGAARHHSRAADPFSVQPYSPAAMSPSSVMTPGSKKRDYCGALRARCAALGPAPLEESSEDPGSEDDVSCVTADDRRSFTSARSSSLSSNEDEGPPRPSPLKQQQQQQQKRPCFDDEQHRRRSASPPLPPRSSRPPCSPPRRSSSSLAASSPEATPPPHVGVLPRPPPPPPRLYRTFDVWLRADIHDPNACPVLKFAGSDAHDVRNLQEHLVACSHHFRGAPRKPQRSYSHPLFREHGIPSSGPPTTRLGDVGQTPAAAAGASSEMRGLPCQPHHHHHHHRPAEEHHAAAYAAHPVSAVVASPQGL